MGTEVNFLWGGDKFNFLQYLVIKSHLRVGHIPVVWISGTIPKGRYWKEIENKIILKNADTVYKIDEFLAGGGNLRTAADLWRWNFLYERGGIWCDSDVFALNHFPDDKWIVCAGEEEPDFLSIAVLKVPPKQEIFLYCIKNIDKVWGNVEIFSKAYGKHFGNTNSTHAGRLFYPYKWRESHKLITKGEIPNDCYSIHYWAKSLEDYLKKRPEVLIARVKQKIFPKSIDNFNEKWCKKNPETMLGKLWQWIENGKKF